MNKLFTHYQNKYDLLQDNHKNIDKYTIIMKQGQTFIEELNKEGSSLKRNNKIFSTILNLMNGTIASRKSEPLPITKKKTSTQKTSSYKTKSA